MSENLVVCYCDPQFGIHLSLVIFHLGLSFSTSNKSYAHVKFSPEVNGKNVLGHVFHDFTGQQVSDQWIYHIIVCISEEYGHMTCCW